MKIVEINMSSDGSTGRIMLQIADKVRRSGHTVHTFSTHRFSLPYEKLPPAPVDHHYFGTYLENCVHFLFTRYTGLHGYFSWIGTMDLIRSIRKIEPDLINIHNLHGSCICIPMLFRFLKKYGKPIVWTMQDCWPITGCCTHFVRANCVRWKTGCGECPLYKEGYLKSVIDQSHVLWKMKKKAYTGFKKLITVPTSKWLERHVKNSILSEYPTKVIYNGIDLNVFHPIKSDFRKEKSINDRFIILGVSSLWDNRKGLDVFNYLAEKLESERYAIVLVGTNDIIDKQLNRRIISIHRTANQNELAKIYSAADLFVNPTREDDFPTVNLESIACGTPIVTFDTGGCSEAIDKYSGCVIQCNDLDSLYSEIIRISIERPYSRNDCVRRAQQFEKENRYDEYIELYNDLLN